jgi:hypothetical protein
VNDYTSTSEIDILKSIVYNEMEKALIKYRTKAIKLSTYNN